MEYSLCLNSTFRLFSALCLVAIIEGLFLFIAPLAWKRMAAQLDTLFERGQLSLFAIDEIAWIGQPGYCDRVCVLNEAIRDKLLTPAPDVKAAANREPVDDMAEADADI